MKKIFASVLCWLVLGGATAHAQSNRRVQIINHSSSAIEYLNAMAADGRSWEKDLLGPMRVIQPGGSIDASVDDGTGHCRFDLRAVLFDGREAQQPDFDVCANISWIVNPANYLPDK